MTSCLCIVSNDPATDMRKGIMEDKAVEGPLQYTIGQDISTFSVEELKRSIAALREEAERLERELQARGSTKATAEALFRRN